MSEHNSDDGSKKAKNIAAVLYLMVLIFLVGGSYLHQQGAALAADSPVSVGQPWIRE